MKVEMGKRRLIIEKKIIHLKNSFGYYLLNIINISNLLKLNEYFIFAFLDFLYKRKLYLKIK